MDINLHLSDDTAAMTRSRDTGGDRGAIRGRMIGSCPGYLTGGLSFIRMDSSVRNRDSFKLKILILVSNTSHRTYKGVFVVGPF